MSARFDRLHIEPELEILVLVKAHGAWSWYVSEKEYWLLDQAKLERMFRAAGHPPTDGAPDRFDILIVDETTCDEFLAHMAPFRVEHERLVSLARTRIASADRFDDVLELFPMLLVDFDARRLASRFPELTRFEKWVPDGWVGEYVEFLDQVPPALRYWVVDGVDLLARLTVGEGQAS